MAGFLERKRRQYRLEQSFKAEARTAAYQDLKQHKFSYYYIDMISAYVRSYCRTKAGAILKNKNNH